MQRPLKKKFSSSNIGGAKAPPVVTALCWESDGLYIKGFKQPSGSLKVFKLYGVLLYLYKLKKSIIYGVH